MIRFIFVSLLLLSSCVSCVTFPDPLVDKDGTMIEPPSCYDYRVCLYYVVVGKLQSDCKLEYIKCCKYRDYDFCKREENLWGESKSQECWDKKQ